MMFAPTTAEGSPRERGAAPGGRDDRNDNADSNEDGHGYDAGDQRGKSFILAGRAHRTFHEDCVEHLAIRCREGHVSDQSGYEKA